MKISQIVMSVFSLFLFSTANAVQITDVKAFDKIFESGEHFDFSFNLLDYGFDLNRDTITGSPILTFEFRDPLYGPDRDPLDAAFITLVIDQGRTYTRVANEDWILNNGFPFFDQSGVMHAFLGVSGDSAWLGDVTLNFEFTPGATTQVPEPLPMLLMGIGLLAISLRRHNRALK